MNSKSVTKGKKNKSSDTVNCALRMRYFAEIDPEKKAFIFSSGKKIKGKTIYSHVTFRELEDKSNQYAFAFNKAGIVQGTKTIIMVKAGPELYCILYGLFKTGAVPVIVDPGMGVKRMLHCLQSTGAEAFIGISAAHAVRILQPQYFKSVKKWITLGRRWFWMGPTLKGLCSNKTEVYEIAPTKRDDLSAISFTTGSTGPAKGVEFTYGFLDAMINQFPEHFNFIRDDIDLVTLPLLAVVDSAIGITAVLPEMNPAKPAMVNPEKILNAIIDNRVTTTFASPALLNRIARYGNPRGIKLNTLKRTISGGAPVSPSIITRFSELLSGDADFIIAYGATEALPISSIESRDMLLAIENCDTDLGGTCIGKPVRALDIKIIKINDEPIEKLPVSDIPEKEEIGELVIKGDHVSSSYYNLPDENRQSKIIIDGELWHRTGDCAWIDNQERIWFCGRKKHRVVTDDAILFTVPCEMVFNRHPKVFRSALVGLQCGAVQKPVICIECEPGTKEHEKKIIRKELLELSRKHFPILNITTILFHKSFPVDIRHNAKIFREKLAVWAEDQIANDR